MLEAQLRTDFAATIRSEAEAVMDEGGMEGPLAWDTALAEAILTRLEEGGVLSEHTLCPYEDATGRGRCRVIAYSLPEDSSRLELITALFRPEGEDQRVGTEDLKRLGGRAARFFDCVMKDDLSRFAPSPDTSEAAHFIAEETGRIDDVRIHVLTNGLARDWSLEPMEIGGRKVEFQVWDLERLHRASGEGVTRERIEIDFRKFIGRPISCLELQPRPKDYSTYLVLVPGDVLYKIYDEFGARLFEFNVRSFLQAKGTVNRGLRDTLKEEPERFLAYNNGITATADEIDVESWHGETTIGKIRGLQIVNGAQTTASVHRAGKEGLCLTHVAVAMKLTRVSAEKLGEFVPNIAKYANTQNAVQVADLSANSEFHIRMEQLAGSVWCPGEESRWFYERARGAYDVARNRFGTTPAKRREFDTENPKGKRFSKTDLAKFMMCWWKLPQKVSRGTQKNFSAFMDEYPKHFAPGWQPDEDFFRWSVAVGLLFKACTSAVRKAKLPSYGAQTAAYMLSKLALDHGRNVDLQGVWEAQRTSAELADLLEGIAPWVHEVISRTANARNIGEWCKKDGCWDAVAAMALDLEHDLPVELVAAEAPEKGEEAPPSSELQTTGPTTDEKLVETCCSVSYVDWSRILTWAAETGKLATYDQRVVRTLSEYAFDGWSKRPSVKQARFGVRAIGTARSAGLLS